MKVSDKFEHQIRRIHELIEQPGSFITWDDKISDPDNPRQPRQIDISIRRDNKLTLIECRIHKEKQDVQWIEELVGRRLSLKADACIAVSASGFTEGAILKAGKFGIILRDFVSLSEEEISSWGYSTKVTLTFYEYSNVYITFKVNSRLSRATIINEIAKRLESSNDLFIIFETISNKIDERNLGDKTLILRAKLGIQNPIIIDGECFQNFSFEARVKKLEKELSIPSVVAYDAPNVPPTNRNIFVEAVELGDFEITQSSNEVIVALDLTPIDFPQNCHFRSVNFDFKRPVHVRKLEILGNPIIKIPLTGINIGIDFN